ncbi:MAG: Uma2 family endonuclease [Gemmataceae bacterium]|nr:Uma2 family endonuclease [Gemmataceae bacterium]
MSTATIPPAPPARSDFATLVSLVGHVRPGQHLVVTDIAWADYKRLVEWRDATRRFSVRLTYDRGSLEVMTVGNLHERLRKALALLVEAWLEETGGEYVPSGQLTHQRDDLARGFEPDECYWIQNWKAVAGLRQIDFAADPPVDLTLEVEVSRSVTARRPILASFRIPEVWCYDGKTVGILMLQGDGTYKPASASRAIPNFPFGEAPRFLEMAADLESSYAAIGRAFRAWIRATFPPKPTA